jgi:hypothetical protein
MIDWIKSRRCLSRTTVIAGLAMVAIGAADSVAASDESGENAATHDAALKLLASDDPTRQLQGLGAIDANWGDYLTPSLLEYVSLARSATLQRTVLEILQRRTRQDFGFDLNAWFSWAWLQDFDQPPYYADFKSRLYRNIDHRFGAYFSSTYATDIRLDEVRWGGVRQDGIPPLREPDMIKAEEADYLDDDNVVFGLEVNGDARAYPKRILAWHEMFVDNVGGVPVVGVYCTLCGSMILYESTANGVQHEMGTSGFLYRSNKLMYDKATQSLWNTMWGTPAIGPLVGQSIRLPRRSVVTTTWGEWQRRHPGTTVLSLETGYSRDYGEGVAYRDYFATDELMFNVSQVDARLANKAVVLGLVFNDTSDRPLAISADYARRNPLLHERIGEREFVVLTDDSGAMRVYESNGTRFKSWNGNRSLRDAGGTEWMLHEDRLVNRNGQELSRLPSHNAFWFGWYGAFTNTRLLH